MKALLKIILRELKLILGDKRVMGIMLFGPFLYGTLFGGVYWYGRVHKVPAIMIDQDHSYMSRQVTQALNNSDYVNIVKYKSNSNDYVDDIRSENAYFAVVIPPYFERDLKEGKPGRLIVMIEGDNLLITNVAYRGIRLVLATLRVQARAQRLLLNGIPKNAILQNANPIQAEYRPLFNPSYNYSIFMLIGLVCISIQQVTMLAICLMLCQESNLERRRSLQAISKNPLMWMLGKFITYALILIPLCLLAIHVPYKVFGTPFHGNWNFVLGMTALYIAMHICIAFGISGFCKSPLLAMHILLSISVPLFVLSGFSWPVYAMPVWMQKICNLLPLTHFADMLRKVSLIGGSVSWVSGSIHCILIWVPISIVWGFWGIHRFARFKDDVDIRI